MKKFLLVLLLVFSVCPLVAEEFDFELFKARKYFRAGFEYYQENKYELAIDFFLRSLENKSHFHIAREWLGKAYYQAGFIDNTIDEWETLLDLGGGDNTLRQKLTYILMSQGESRKYSPVRDYAYVRSYTGHALKKGRFSKPVSILIDPENILMVSGFSSRNVITLDVNGDLVRDLHPGLTGFKNPYGICRHPDGSFYMADFGRDRVLRFDKHLMKTDEFGGSGITNGAFAGPEALVVDHNGHVLVVDNGNNRIQKFDSEGNFLMTFGSKGNRAGQLYRPSGIALGPDGTVYISDYGNARIQAFDADGNYLETIGEGILAGPRGMKRSGDLLIAADGPGGIFFYDLKKRLWWQKNYWDGGQLSSLNIVDVDVNQENNVLYAADLNRNTVDVFMPNVFRSSSLFVDVQRINSRQYPLVGLFIDVRTRDGRPVQGLQPENFQVFEDGVPVSSAELVDEFDSGNSLVFLVDRSVSMEKYTIELLHAADFLLNPRQTADRFSVLNVNEKVWAGSDFDHSRLRIREALSEQDLREDLELGSGLYRSVTGLIDLFSRKAVVLFTSGRFEVPFAFSDHSLDVITYYARNNHVPLFIIAFTEENRSVLEDLAHATGGQYYYYFGESEKLRRINDDVNALLRSQYILTYETARFQDVKKWRNVELNVDFQGMAGKDSTGYFLP